jgi:hypothetical protein
VIGVVTASAPPANIRAGASECELPPGEAAPLRQHARRHAWYQRHDQKRRGLSRPLAFLVHDAGLYVRQTAHRDPDMYRTALGRSLIHGEPGVGQRCLSRGHSQADEQRHPAHLEIKRSFVQHKAGVVDFGREAADEAISRETRDRPHAGLAAQELLPYLRDVHSKGADAADPGDDGPLAAALQAPARLPHA